jgi:hypoxanthine phosphoribosyltransferase
MVFKLFPIHGLCDKDDSLIRMEKAMSIKWHRSETVESVLLDSRTIQNRVREMGTQITRDYSGRIPHLIGILKGACIFHADLVRAIELELSFDFIAIGSYGDKTKSSGEVRLLKDVDESLEGKDVILVDDIIDTGLSLHYLIRNLSARGPASLRTAVLLNKPSRREVDVPVEYIGFDIPDEFVVGYGLDYGQRYRNLPDICVLRLEKSV